MTAIVSSYNYKLLNKTKMALNKVNISHNS